MAFRYPVLMLGSTPVLMPLIHETVFPKRVERGDFSPLRKQRPVAGRHVLDELRHLQGEVELAGDFGVALLQLNKVLLELVVAKQRVLVVGWVVDDSAAELRGRGTDAQSHDEQANQNLSFHRTFLLSLPSEIGRHFVVVCNRATRDRPRDRL